MLAFNILSVASIHNVVRPSFYLCCPFARKDQMEFIPVVKVKRDHVAGRYFVDICNNLLVRDTGQVCFDQGYHLVSGKAGLILR